MRLILALSAAAITAAALAAPAITQQQNRQTALPPAQPLPEFAAEAVAETLGEHGVPHQLLTDDAPRPDSLALGARADMQNGRAVSGPLQIDDDVIVGRPAQAQPGLDSRRRPEDGP